MFPPDNPHPLCEPFKTALDMAEFLDGFPRYCNTTWGHLLVNLKHYAERGVKNPYFT